MMMRIMLSTAALAVFLCSQASSSHAQSYGHAPWCAVVNYGTGEVVWECEYYSAAECAPNVVAGNRGFCNLNPYWRADVPAKVALKHRKHRGSRD